MYGGSGGRESRPQYVQNEWSMASEFVKGFSGAVSGLFVPGTPVGEERLALQVLPP